MKYLINWKKAGYHFLFKYQTFNEELPIGELQNAAAQLGADFPNIHKKRRADVDIDILNGVYDTSLIAS